jgi:hypothetical protein
VSNKDWKKTLTVISKDRSKLNVVLQDYKYIPDLWVNLFTLMKCLNNGWVLEMKDWFCI